MIKKFNMLFIPYTPLSSLKQYKQTHPNQAPPVQPVPALTSTHDQRQSHATKGTHTTNAQSKNTPTQCKKTKAQTEAQPIFSGGYPK
jgi:hypothetical protein